MSKEAFQWSDDQIEALIDLVKENDAIYNTRHYNHRNRQAVEQIWTKIDLQLKKPPGVCREQWQKLRICYRRNFSSDGPKARWRFYNKLNFLSEYLRFIDPDNSLSMCIKRAEEKIFSDSSDSNLVENTPAEDDEKSEDQIKSEDNISIYYLTDEEMTIENDEHDGSDDEDNEYHLVEYIQDENETLLTSASKVELTKRSIKTIKKNIKKRNYYNEDNGNMDTIVENVTSSKDEDDVVKLNEEPDRKKIKSYSPTNEDQVVIPTALSQTIVTIQKEQPPAASSSVSAPTQTIIEQIEQQPVNVVTCLCQNDTDTIFLRSILEDFKSMSKKNKCSFKIKVQKAIQDILYPDDD